MKYIWVGNKARILYGKVVDIMKLGRLDLDPRFEYIVIYKDKRDNTVNTWTLNDGALRVNYKQMKKSGNVEFLGIYQKLTDSQLLDIMTR